MPRRCSLPAALGGQGGPWEKALVFAFTSWPLQRWRTPFCTPPIARAHAPRCWGGKTRLDGLVRMRATARWLGMHGAWAQRSVVLHGGQASAMVAALRSSACCISLRAGAKMMTTAFAETTTLTDHGALSADGRSADGLSACTNGDKGARPNARTVGQAARRAHPSVPQMTIHMRFSGAP